MSNDESRKQAGIARLASDLARRENRIVERAMRHRPPPFAVFGRRILFLLVNIRPCVARSLQPAPCAVSSPLSRTR